MSYQVRFTPDAEQDLGERLEFLARHDALAARRALAALRKATRVLETFPFACRRAPAASDPRYRELVVPFGKDGHVLLFEVTDAATVSVLAVRHQREDDYF